MIRGSAIDIGLALLETVRSPGETFTHRQIVEVINALADEGFGKVHVTHQDIFYLQERGIEKIRAAYNRRLKGERVAEVLRNGVEAAA